MQPLDDFYKEEKNVTKNTFSKLGFICAMLTFASTMYAICSMPTTIKPSEEIQVANFAFVAIYLFAPMGFICSIISIFRKERLPYFKKWGIFLNFLLFGMLVYCIWYFHFGQ